MSAEQRAALPGWLVFRRRFKTPEACAAPSAACSLLIGEVGDAVEAQLNGLLLGRHGGLPPNARYAKHYPARFDISPEAFSRGASDNELVLKVYSMKRNQAGLVRGPLGVFSSERGFSLSKSLITLNVILPIVGCVALFLMGAIPALTGMFSRERDGRFYSFIGFCFAHSFFLLSFSEVPREHLPIWISGYLHFLSRIASDWAYFNMVQKHYEFPAKPVRLAQWGYYGVATAFVLMFLHDGIQAGAREGGFDTAFLIMRAAFPLLLLPHLMGLIGAFRQRDTLAGKVFTALFGLTLAMQTHDCLIFHGFISGAYTVKVYPVFIGAAFGWLTLERYHRERERLLVAEGIAGVLTQVAHDIRSPLDVLECVANDAAGLPMAERSMLQASVSRIREIACEVIRSYREAAPAPQGGSRAEAKPQESQRLGVHCLFELLGPILAEKRLEYRSRPGIRFGLQCDSAAYRARARLDPAEFRRAVSNLINNGVEAAGEQGSVGLSLRVVYGQVLLTIRDTGPGISQELLSQLGRRGVSSGKSGGCGLGIHYAKASIEAWGGSLRIESEPGRGTAVTLALPAAEASEPQAGIPAGEALCTRTIS